MKKQHLTQTGRTQCSHPNLQNMPGSLADKLDKAFESPKKYPPMPKNYYPVRFSHKDDSIPKNPKRIYYADTHNDAVRFLGTLRIWGWIKPHKGGMEWEVRV